MPPDGMSESDQKAVHEELDRILKSGPFLQSRRRQRFLEYIVTETLAGRGERLKGYNVARDVFDRSEAFDPNVDPTVRMEAGRLRDRLREYYETDGRSDPIRIDLPKGTYTPQLEFRKAEAFETGPEGAGTTTPDQGADCMQAPAAHTGEQPASSLPRSKPGLRWQIAVSAVALILLLGAVGAWLSLDRWVPTPVAAVEDPVVEVTKGPAIAVLPFLNVSDDPKQEYFSDGLTEDIMTELSRAGDLRVLARNTAFQYRGQAVDAMKLGRDLKVRYVLEGSIQRSDDRLRVTAQLIDTESGTLIWADRFDREMADVFLVQDDIVSQIVGKIAGGYGVIESTEAKSATRKSPNEIQAYDLVLRARNEILVEYNSETIRSAIESLRQAIALDPLNARARREMAWLGVIGWVFRLEDETPPLPHEILEQATEAVQLDPADPRARMVAASAYFFDKQLDLFEHEAQQAMALAPHDAEILAPLGDMIASSGHWQRGVALVTKANALNAYAAVGWYQATMYKVYYLNGDYERALEVIRQDPAKQSLYKYIYNIAVYGQLGRKQEALENWRKLLEERPGWSSKSFENWYRIWNLRDEDIAKLMDGIRKSGVLGVEAKPG